VAEAPTRCLALPSWEFERVLLANPELSLAILRGLARRLRSVVAEHRA
jgi:CRP-like cAMP-binding protein